MTTAAVASVDILFHAMQISYK